MLIINRYTVFNYKRTCLLACLVLALLHMTSCNALQKEKREAYFKSVFKKVDSSYATRYYFTTADMHFLDSAVNETTGAGLAATAEKYLRKIAYYHVTRNNINSAMLYADSVVLLLRDHTGDEKLGPLYASAIFTKGDIYFNLKNYDEAISNYTFGKTVLSATLKDSCKLFGYYNSMAFALYAQHQYLPAARFFRLKGLAAAACADQPYLRYLDVQENLSNAGMGYAKAGLADSAMFYYKAALHYIDSSENVFLQAPKSDFAMHRAVVYFNQAEVFYQQKDTATAEKLFLQSIAGCDTSDTGFVRTLHLSLANLYIGSNQIKKAGDILNGLFKSVDSTEISSTAGDFYKTLFGYYSKTGQLTAAYTALMHAYNISDSIETTNHLLNSLNIQKEFEKNERQMMNQALQKDTKIKNNYLLVSLAGIGLAVVAILMVWHLLRRKSAYAKRLKHLNDEVIRSNDDLRKTLSSLEQSNSENTRLTLVVAHDLKNPLSAVRSLVYSLLKKEQKPDTKIALELMQTTCVNSIALIRDLLDKRAKLPGMNKELVDMGRLIEESSQLFQVKAAEKNQELKLNIDYPVVMLNRQNMLRVVNNIVYNAIKFSPADADIIIQLERKENSVLLSVKDNGIGIPANLKDKIFTHSPDISRAGTAGEESYGLGLSISRKIIEEHEGKLWFESEAGKGSIFFVELPYSVN